MHSINKYIANRREITFIELKNENISVTFMDMGATLISIFTKDKHGKSESILMAYKNLKDYIEGEMYLNATIGPFSGRIANASFTLNNKKIKLEKNFFKTENLHGGFETLAYKVFDYKVEENKVIFTYRKKKECSKFPGNQTFKITYTLSDNDLLIEFEANTDEDTLVNLTNHAYFNLSGNLKSNIMDHTLQINSSKTLELNEKFAPVGVKETLPKQLDFKKEKHIKDNFYEGIYDLPEKGIDNPLLLDEVSFDIPQVILKDSKSGRKMEVYTTYPCVVVYTHNHPDKRPLLFGAKHEMHMGICFETQYEPNGINVEGLNKSILKKEDTYYEKTKLTFSIEE